MNELDAEKFVRLHKFTVMALCGTLLFICGLFCFVVLWYVPSIIASQRETDAPRIIKQALNEVLDERIELAK